MLTKKFFLPLLLLVTLPCFADELSKLDAIQKIKFDNNLLMLDVIKATTIGSKDSLARIEKELPIYESLVELTCMPDITRTLEYTDYNPETPEGKECSKYIEKLEELLPSDPILLCAKNGINSTVCKDGYDAQYLSVVDPNKDDAEEIDVKDKVNLEMSESAIKELEESIEKKIDSLPEIDKLIELVKNINPEKAEIIKMGREKVIFEIEDQYNKYVNLKCSNTKISVVSDKAPDASMLINKQDSVKTNSKLEKLILKLAEEKKALDKSSDTDQKIELENYPEPFSEEAKITPTPTPTPALKFWRIRQITTQCNDAIDKALEYSPNIYAAICKKYGETSPHCIKRMRKVRKNRLTTLKSSDMSHQADGLAVF